MALEDYADEYESSRARLLRRMIRWPRQQWRQRAAVNAHFRDIGIVSKRLHGAHDRWRRVVFKNELLHILKTGRNIATLSRKLPYG